MITLSVRGLAKSTTEESLTKVFEKYGTVHSIKLVKDLFTGHCRGFAEVKMEGHEAREAISSLNNKEIEGSFMQVGLDRFQKGKNKGRRR